MSSAGRALLRIGTSSVSFIESWCSNSKSLSTAYSSAYSLDNLYGVRDGAGVNRRVPTKPAEPESPDFNGYIPLDKLRISYARSSGPGGQHANTTNSRAEVRFKVAEAHWIPDFVRERFVGKFVHRITKDGDMIIRSERTRTQSLNLADCLDKLRFSVRECIEEIREDQDLQPEIAQKLENRKQWAAKIRLTEKRRHSEKRQQRSGVM